VDTCTNTRALWAIRIVEVVSVYDRFNNFPILPKEIILLQNLVARVIVL
jgi:hypothetical protein